MFITARKRSLGQGNIFTPVCHSVHMGGGEYLGRDTPWDQVSPGTRYRYPREQVHPPRYTSRDQVHPPWTRYTPRPGTPPTPWDQVHPPGPSTPPRPGTPPSSACWEIRATSGRYASYWNAFLLYNIFDKRLANISSMMVCSMYGKRAKSNHVKLSDTH